MLFRTYRRTPNFELIYAGCRCENATAEHNEYHCAFSEHLLVGKRVNTLVVGGEDKESAGFPIYILAHLTDCSLHQVIKRTENAHKELYLFVLTSEQIWRKWNNVEFYFS